MTAKGPRFMAVLGMGKPSPSKMKVTLQALPQWKTMGKSRGMMIEMLVLMETSTVNGGSSSVTVWLAEGDILGWSLEASKWPQKWSTTRLWTLPSMYV